MILILVSAPMLLLTSFHHFDPKTYLSVAHPFIFLTTDLTWHFFASISLYPIQVDLLKGAFHAWHGVCVCVLAVNELSRLLAVLRTEALVRFWLLPRLHAH